MTSVGNSSNNGNGKLLGGSRTGSLKSFGEAAGATRNLRRFGQSIKRVVREVQEESSASEPRDVLVSRHHRLCRCQRILNEAYQLTLAALVTLHNRYLRSKETSNVFARYNMLRAMVRETLEQLEHTWWSEVELPKQTRAEAVQDFMLRVCAALETLRVPIGQDAHNFDDHDKETRTERVNAWTSTQVQAENETLINQTYRLLKKYVAVRQIVANLNTAYKDSKVFPMFPRYRLLKEMIKEVSHHPDYMENRHESRVQPE